MRSYSEEVKERLSKHKVPEKVILNTLNYLEKKQKNKPKIAENFLNRLQKAKIVPFKAKKGKKRLQFTIKYNYVKLKSSDEFVSINKIKKKQYCEQKIAEAKFYKRDIVKNPKLRVNLHSLSGVRVRMRLLGDGWIDNRGLICYYNDDKDARGEFCTDLEKLFGKLKFLQFGSKIFVPKRICGLLEINLNLQRGSGVYINPHMDKDILNGTEKIKCEACRVYFGDEGRFHAGTVEVKRSLGYTTMPEISQSIDKLAILSPPNLFIDFEKLLISLGIDGITMKPHLSDALVIIDKKNRLMVTVPWSLTFSGKENLKKFVDEISFGIEYKDNAVRKYLENLKYPKIGQKFYRERLWGICTKIQKEQGNITVNNFAKYTKKSISGTRKCLYWLQKKRLMEKISGGEILRDELGRSKGRTEFEYALMPPLRSR